MVSRRANPYHASQAGPPADVARTVPGAHVKVSMSASAGKRRFARIDRLPPYVFNITAELKLAARRRGEDIIDMSMGNPDGATPAHIVAKLTEVAQRPDTHGYSASKGIPRLRRAIARWYRERYAVEIDADKEAIVTIGSKEGLAHLMLATLDRGDTVLVPDPSYPIHIYGAVIAGADIRSVPLVPGVDFFAELERAIRGSYPKPKMMVLGFQPKLVILVLAVVAFLAAAYFWIHWLNVPTGNGCIALYAILVWLITFAFDYVTDLHLEVLIPAFALGCIIKSNHLHGSADYETTTHPLKQGHDWEAVLDAVVKGGFMLLAGMAMPRIAVGGMNMFSRMKMMKGLMSGNLGSIAQPGANLLRTKRSGWRGNTGRNRARRDLFDRHRGPCPRQ